MNTKSSRKVNKIALLKGNQLTLAPLKSRAWHKTPIRDKLRKADKPLRNLNREDAA